MTGGNKVIEPTKRFSGLATSYSAGRPDYPASAIEFIVGKCGLNSNSTIADVGCGTGISSRMFAQRNINVIGVEPNEDMRNQANAEPRAGSGTVPEYREGGAEATGLDDHSVDLVLAAQAFHWFRPDEAIAEFCRILHANGWITLIWNERADSDAFTTEYGQLLRSFPETSKVEMHRHKAGQALLDSERVVNTSLTWFAHEQKMDWEGLNQRAFSTSYAPKQSPEKEILIEGLQRLFDKYQSGGSVILQYSTSVYLGQPRQSGEP